LELAVTSYRTQTSSVGWQKYKETKRWIMTEDEKEACEHLKAPADADNPWHAWKIDTRMWITFAGRLLKWNGFGVLPNMC
jgi:hypothetical protein